MLRDLRAAQETSFIFPAEQYVNIWPAHKHDHFLIPAGTVHCSGKNGMVLEISATPYIFTFKLWDWDRVGLDDKRVRSYRPRRGEYPVGPHNCWVRNNLIARIDRFLPARAGRKSAPACTNASLSKPERHWFHEPVPHHTQGTVNVLNLVEGEEAVVESPTAAFSPFIAHYAETFIVPAAVAHIPSPHGPSIGKQCARSRRLCAPKPKGIIDEQQRK